MAGVEHQFGGDHRESHSRPRAALDPERDLGLQDAGGREQPPQGRRQRRVGRQAQLLRRHRLGRAGRELRQLPLQGPPGRGRGAPRLARVGGAGRHQAPGGRDHRQQRPVPRLARRQPAGGGNGFQPSSDVPADTSDFEGEKVSAAASPTTTSPSRSFAEPASHEPRFGGALSSCTLPARSMARQQRTNSGPSGGGGGGGRRRRGLSDRGRPRKYTTLKVDHIDYKDLTPAAPLHLRPRQDPLPTGHRPLPQAPGAACAGGEARPRAGAAPLRRRAVGRWPRRCCSRTSRDSARPATRSRSSRATSATTWSRASSPSRPPTARWRRPERRRERAAGRGEAGRERAGETAEPPLQDRPDDQPPRRRGRQALRLGHLGRDRRRDPGRPRAEGGPQEDPARGADPRDRDLHGRGRGRRRDHRRR